MISVSDLRLTAWCSLLFSFLIYTRLPLISWFSLLISVLTHTVLYFSSVDITYSTTSAKNHGEAKGYTFQWKIENLSYCWLKKEECIQSPVFTADSLNGTKWSIRLFPKGLKNDNSVTVFLKREKDYCGPNAIQVKYQITFLDKNGSVLEYKPIWENHFKRECSVFFCVCEREENERNFLLPKDTLTVQCKIWKEEEKPTELDVLSARTIFKVHRRSFVWRIDNFSTLKPGRRSKFVLIDKFTDGLINFHLVLNEGLGSEKKLDIDIRSLDDFIQFISFKASIIDSEGKKVNCGNHEYSDGDLKKGMLFPLFFIKNMFTNKESLYLPNDVLSLDCEYIFSAVTSSNECARCGFLSSSIAAETVRNKSEIDVKKEASVSGNDFENQNERFVRKQEAQMTSVLMNDLKSMYSNAMFCDVELRTSTKTFPAHRAILIARSSVFRIMFSSDMKEKHSGHVDITDLEDETVHRMLMYIYLESLGDLQMESASKLYTAADKYDIPSLKHKCSSFLKHNMNPNTVCDVLVLADMHQDNFLKSAAQDYIMKHDKEIFNTLEWKHFMKNNLQLAADVMYSNVSRQELNEEKISFC
ncbi:unnamed protein product [Larinioides sclopetarius]|uniref:Uncharacterized protein n=1 Tax=Larinioides sclopetarius TaxID=280406 RepID=A0AAV1ZVC6_9ARAC